MLGHGKASFKIICSSLNGMMNREQHSKAHAGNHVQIPMLRRNNTRFFQ